MRGWGSALHLPWCGLLWSNKPWGSLRLAVLDVGDFDVAHGGEGGEEVEALEDEADLGAAHFGAFGVGEFGEVGAVDEDRAGGGVGEAAEDVEKGGFSGAGRAYDGDELAGGDGEV